MSSRPSPDKRLKRHLTESVSIVFAMAGIAATILASSYSQLNHNLRIASHILLPIYIVAVTGGLIILIIMARNRNTDLPPSLLDNSLVVAVPHRSSQLRTDMLRQAVERAKRIDAIGIANNGLTSDLSLEFYREFLLRRRGKVRLLFLEPNCDAIKAREVAESRAEGTLSMFVQHNLEDISQFAATCALDNPNISSQVEVRLYNALPVLNAIIVDNDIAFVHSYASHSRGYDVPTFIISKAAGDVFEFYLDEFDSLWHTGKQWQLIGVPAPGSSDEASGG